MAEANRGEAREPQGTIRVRGTGMVTAAPDLATLQLSVSALREGPDEAMTRMSERTAALLDLLRASGVEERDISTRDLSFNAEYVHGERGEPPVLRGWRAAQTLAVRLRDFERLGATITAAVGVLEDTANVQHIGFEIADPGPLLREARLLAVDEARSKAAALAAHLGVRLGRLVLVEDAPGWSGPSPRGEMMMRTAAVPVSPGELTVSATVELVYAIA